MTDLTPILTAIGLAISNLVTWRVAESKGRTKERESESQDKKDERDAEQKASDALWTQMSGQLAELSKRLDRTDADFREAREKWQRKERQLSLRVMELEGELAVSKGEIKSLRRENEQLRNQQAAADDVVEALGEHVTVLQRQVKELGAEPAPAPPKKKRGTIR